MKKIPFIFLSILMYNNYGFCAGRLVCQKEERKQMRDEYWYANANKQIYTEQFNQLDEQGKREARIRNLCFGATLSWVGFCSIYEYCKLCENGECIPIPKKEKFGGKTFEEYCNLAKTDCFGGNINDIFSLMERSNDSVYKMFNPNINDIVKNLSDGKNVEISVIDTDNSVCYRTDDNGDTIWHALIRSHHNDTWSWADLCASYLKFDKFSNALYNVKNKKGVSAFKEVLNSNDTSNQLFYFLSSYARQEGINYNDFVKKIATANNVSISDVQKIIKR